MIYLLLTLIETLAAPLHAFAQATSTVPSFVSLSDIPAFADVINSSGAVDLSKVLNSIYGLCIGLAAVLAVIQLMYAGMIYMGGDSVTEKKVARQKITAALLGLLLVLSPAIVFGIIDKRILSLSIDTSALNSTAVQQPTGTGWGIQLDSGTSTPSKGGSIWDAALNALGMGGSTGVSSGAQAGAQIGQQIIKNSPIFVCKVYPEGTTQIAADGTDDKCCTAQTGCTLIKGTRGQNSCTCTAPQSAPSGYFDAN